MQDDIICQIEHYDTWMALKDKFGGTSAIKLRRLAIKLNLYKKSNKHFMSQYLREISNMIRELKSIGYVIFDEQQVQAVIQSLSHS